MTRISDRTIIAAALVAFAVALISGSKAKVLGARVSGLSDLDSRDPVWRQGRKRPVRR